MTTINELEHYYKHFDNGGIHINIIEETEPNEEKDDYFRQIVIEFSTGYYDYPNLVTRLNTWGNLDENDLEEIGLMFIRAAGKLKEGKNLLCKSE